MEMIRTNNETMNVPQKAAMMHVSCPPMVHGKLSPYPTVVEVITISQIAEPKSYRATD